MKNSDTEEEAATLEIIAGEDSKKADNVWVQDLRIGSVIDQRYRIVALLGKGANGTVYKAEDLEAQSFVALKILHSHLASDPVIVRRFEQEAKAAAMLKHPNIVSVHSLNRLETGEPYLVMSFYEGSSLESAIKAAGYIPTRRALEIAVQVSAALVCAHERGIVHRDLKPGNIFLTTSSDGNLLVKVLDFGVAKILNSGTDSVLKLTQSGEALGSLLYMSPEQCLDQDLDGRSDIYSLGALLYEAITGRAPLMARTAFETMNKQISEMPNSLATVRPDLEFPKGLEAILFKAMAKNPKQRYQNAAEFQSDLKLVLSGSPRQISRLDNNSSALAPSLSNAIANTQQFIERTKKLLMIPAAVIALIGFLVCVITASGPLGADLFLILMFGGMAVLFMLFPFLFGRRYENIMRIAKNTEPSSMRICAIKCIQDLPQGSIYSVELATVEPAKSETHKAKITPVGPGASAKLRCLYTAFELDNPAGKNAKCFVYFNEKNKPVALVIGDEFAAVI